MVLAGRLVKAARAFLAMAALSLVVFLVGAAPPTPRAEAHTSLLAAAAADEPSPVPVSPVLTPDTSGSNVGNITLLLSAIGSTTALILTGLATFIKAIRRPSKNDDEERRIAAEKAAAVQQALLEALAEAQGRQYNGRERRVEDLGPTAGVKVPKPKPPHRDRRAHDDDDA